MKKCLLVLLLMMFLCPSIGAQTFKRTTKMPSFFVPKGALQTENRPENLMPVGGMQRMLQENNPELKGRYMDKGQIQAVDQEQNKYEKTENAPTNIAKENNTQRENVALTQENNLAVNTDKKGFDETKYVEEPIVSPEDEEFFAQIIEEYHRDILEVNKGKTDLDKRIVEMVSDYKKFEHQI